jgi:SAM-dependent methyltransferase
VTRHVLQLGAGRQRLAVEAGDRLVRLDLRPDTRPDVVWNLDRFPYPFADDTFDYIDCTDVLEHLFDLVRVMEELHRIGKPGCRIHIATPHFSSSNSYTDPTHLHHLAYRSFDYFTGDNPWSFYSRVRFAKRRSEIVFHPSPLNRLVSRLARRWPDVYERRFAWLFPAWFLSFELLVAKPSPPLPGAHACSAD